MSQEWEQILGSGLDRGADVPIGTQLAWLIRARIGAGALRPGDRLPAGRDMARLAGLNPNTVRAVYQRLEQDGLIEGHRGRGTFVAPREPVARELAAIARHAALAAREAGIDPRDVAASLYVDSDTPPAAALPPEDRRTLRNQIAALERALRALEAVFPGVAQPPASDERRRPAQPRVLELEELRAARDELAERLTRVQQTVGAPGAPIPAATPAAAPRRKGARPAARLSLESG